MNWSSGSFQQVECVSAARTGVFRELGAAVYAVGCRVLFSYRCGGLCCGSCLLRVVDRGRHSVRRYSRDV